MKIAIVHDYLNQFGGAERVISALHEAFPLDPIYTSIFDEKRMPDIFQRMDIRTSFMQKFPFISSLFKYYLLFYPLAFESFDLSEYDLILSSSSAWAKGVKKRDGQLHICYCHTPMRFVWRYEDYVKRESIPSFLKNLLPLLLDPIKKWDLQTAQAVDFFIANSRTVAERIEKTYGRESVIINPPVECDFFKPSALDHDYFLVVSRLNPYKRIDVVVEAFNKLDLPLKIIGDGPGRSDLQRMAGPNIEFLGRLLDQDLAKHMAECRALVFPGEEDFGIVPLEAMSAGRPVIAYKAGGAEETVMDGETGMFFEKQTADSLIQAIKRFQFRTFNKNKIREHALKFDKERFKREIMNFIKEKTK
ncbi:MAG: glycosyltransferase [Candidatus Margulisiibacteriota bacterium]